MVFVTKQDFGHDFGGKKINKADETTFKLSWFCSMW